MRRTVLNKFYGMDIYGRWFGREVKIMITFLLLMFNGSVFFVCENLYRGEKWKWKSWTSLCGWTPLSRLSTMLKQFRLRQFIIPTSSRVYDNIVLCDDSWAISSVLYAWQATMLAHIVTIVRIRQSQTPNDGRNGAVDDTVLSKITTKRSFTVLWHLSEPPSPRFYLGSGQCEKRGGSLILWSVNVIMIRNAVLSFMPVYKWIAKHNQITCGDDQIVNDGMPCLPRSIPRFA